MEKAKIVVPRLDWLIGGSRIGSDYNRYYGSIGTDPLKGCFNCKIFNYTVRIEKEDETEVIKVSWYPGTTSFKNTPEESITSAIFPLEEESREKIGSWLENEYGVFVAD